MEFALGLLIGMFIMWAIAMRVKSDFLKDLEKLKDFETWKEWKNQNKQHER